MSVKRMIITSALLALLPIFACAQDEFPMMCYERVDNKTGVVSHETLCPSFLQTYAFDACIDHKDALKLTKVQIKMINAKHSEIDKKLEALKSDMAKAQNEMDAYLKARPRDFNKAAAKAREIQSLQDSQGRIYHEINLEMEKILTAEQKDKFYSIYAGNVIR